MPSPGRRPLQAVPPAVPQLQRHLPLHLYVLVEVGDEQLGAPVDIVVPRRRRRAARPRHAPRPEARRPGRPCWPGGRREAALHVEQARPRVEADAARRRAGNGTRAGAGDGGEDPPRRAEGEQEPDLLDRRPEAAEERGRPLLGLHGWRRSHGARARPRLLFLSRFRSRSKQCDYASRDE